METFLIIACGILSILACGLGIEITILREEKAFLKKERLDLTDQAVKRLNRKSCPKPINKDNDHTN